MWNSNNGFVPSGQQMPIEAAVEDCATKLLNIYITQKGMPRQLADYIYDSYSRDKFAIVSTVGNRFVQGGQFDDNSVLNFLDSDVFAQYIRNAEMEAQRTTCNSYNNYSNYNSYRPDPRANIQYGNSPMYGNNNGFQNSGISSIQNAVESGIGRSLSKRTVSQQPAMTAGSVSREYTTPVDRVEQIPLEVQLLKIIKEHRELRKELLKANVQIDKITENTNELLYSETAIDNVLLNPAAPTTTILGEDSTGSFDRTKCTATAEEPLEAEGFDISYHGTFVGEGESIYTSQIDMKIPVNTADESIKTITKVFPKLFTTSKWMHFVSYNEIVAKELPNGGEEASKFFTNIATKLKTITNMNQVSIEIVPSFEQMTIQLRNYLVPLVFSKINRLLKSRCFKPDTPTIYPQVSTWKDIFKLLEKDTNEYTKYMLTKYEKKFPKLIFEIIYSVLSSIFIPDSDDDNTVVTTEGMDLGILAHASGLNVIQGRYRISDYSFLPTGHLDIFKRKINKDWLVHLYKQNIFAINMDPNLYLATPSKYTIVEKSQTLLQRAIETFISTIEDDSTPDCRMINNYTLLVYDESGTTILGIYNIGVNLDDRLLIERI